jgi:hypothetical protein
MTNDDDEVLAAQNRFDAAELHDDRGALDELIAEDFRSIGPKGFVLDKRQWIDRHDNFRYHELKTSEIEVRRYGDAAIVRNLQTNHATHDYDDVRLTVRVSQTWVKLEGRWQIAGIQFSPMAAA